MNRNDFKRNITQALDEMKKEQGDSFDLSKVMIAATGKFKCQNNLIGSELGSNFNSPKMIIPQTPVA